MQTPEAGADSTSTVPLQTAVPVQPTGSTQQVPVQQQVQYIQPACVWMFLRKHAQRVSYISVFVSGIFKFCELNH